MATQRPIKELLVFMGRGFMAFTVFLKSSRPQHHLDAFHCGFICRQSDQPWDAEEDISEVSACSTFILLLFGLSTPRCLRRNHPFLSHSMYTQFLWD